MMSLTLKEKELVAVGASVAAGCKPCTNYHVKKVQEAEASDEEIQQAIADAICVRKSAAEIMENHGRKHLGMATENEDCGCTDTSTRIRELVSVAAALAVNCSSNLKKHIAAARTAGITDDEMKAVLDLAVFVKRRATSLVDRIAERIGNTVFPEETTEDTGGCGCSDEAKATTHEPVKETSETEKTAAVAAGGCGCGGDC